MGGFPKTYNVTLITHIIINTLSASLSSCSELSLLQLPAGHMKTQWICKEHCFALSKQKEKKSNIMNDYWMRLGITCMRPKGNYANRGGISA